MRQAGAPFITDRPLGAIERLGRTRGLWRLADRLTKVADVRHSSGLARLVRSAAGFPIRPLPMYWFSGRPNFGDVLSPVIVGHVSNGTPVHVSGRYRGKLLAAGSVLDRVAEGDTVWGTGLIKDRTIDPPRGVRFLAVRGPLTRALIRADVPEVYGDPAFLLPRIYTPPLEKRFELGVFPHAVEREAIDIRDPSIRTINARSDWRTVVDAIASCHGILSSSLHGLIVAEAYGIPAAWIEVTDRVVGAGFKFRDYYLSTGREPPAPLRWPALTIADRYLGEPPTLDPEPLLRVWPEELTFAPVLDGDAGP